MSASPTLEPRFRPPCLGARTGAALFARSDNAGWDHPPLYLPCPLLVLRVNRHGTRVETPEGLLVDSHDDITVTPFHWMEEILHVLAESSKGTERRAFLRPGFPLAVVCAAYEFGRVFNPHEGCFPHTHDLETDDLFVAFHCTGFARVDNRWKLVGRPPGRGAVWRDWAISEEATDWPMLPSEFSPALEAGRSSGAFEPVPRLGHVAYDAAVRRIQAHLAAGDIYQANLTVRFEGECAAPADLIFASGLAEGGDRFAMSVRARGQSHVSFSPELFLRRWGRTVTTRPIKGTRASTGDPATDERLAQELLDSEKDRAEHVMIVDLERSDLGRLCEYGSVRADPFMEVTRHPRLLHLESTVSGTLRSSISFRDMLTALFPGGSVTGAPKKRAMEIISNLENAPRGLYCGAMGWFDSRGDCDLNLPIRTATRFDDGRIHLHAGGAIVADSTAEHEWQELLLKMSFLRDAIGLAVAAP